MQKKNTIFNKVKEMKLIKKKVPRDLPLPTKYLLPQELIKLHIIKHDFRERREKFSERKQKGFLEDFLIRFTYYSNKFDGNPLSKEQTRKILLGKQGPEGKKRYIKEVENNKEAFTYILHHQEALTRTFILRLHKILMQGIDESGGELRKQDVEIYGSHYLPPGWDILDYAFTTFIDWYNEAVKTLHPFETALLLHLKFVSLHPFMDGNGRAARWLHNMLLWKNNYPMFDFSVKQEDYFSALEESHIKDAEEPFMDWFKKAYIG